MPTLHVTRVEVEESLGSNVGETATTADFALFSLPSPANRLNADGDDNQEDRADDDHNLNDTTLSGTLLEEALHILRMEKDATRRQENSAASSTQQSDGGGCDRPSEVHRALPSEVDVYPASRAPLQPKSVVAESSLLELEEQNDCYESFDMSPPKCVSTSDMLPGDQERLYRNKYAGLVGNWIQQAKHKLKDYRSLNSEEKEFEQERVIRLLHRLGIGTLRCEDPIEAPTPRHTETTEDRTPSSLSLACKQSFVTCEFATAQETTAHAKTVLKFQDHNMRLKLDDSVSFAVENGESMVLPSPAESKEHYHRGLRDPLNESEALLSPSPSANPKRLPSARRTPPLHQDQDSSNDSIDSSSDDSVEVVLLHGKLYKSPTISGSFHRKRLASTSGKRGSDMSRARSLSPSSFALPAATAPPHLFSASQSPISPYAKLSHVRSNSPLGTQTDVSFGNSSSHSSRASPRKDSILHTEQDSWVNTGLLRDCSNDVRLKSGATFHLNPLETRSTRHWQFPDPFHLYDKKQTRRLMRVYEKLHRREKTAYEHPDAIARSVVLSMEMPMVYDLILKLTRETNKVKEQISSLTQGKTLIVARDRVQLDEWGRAFREASNLSVLNHSTLPVVQRKTRSTADKCCNYDITLSTFDCLKSPDVTVPLDENGFPSWKVGNADGWCSSRNSQPEDVKCKLLSVLHCVTWHRIVFIDFIGRKSYLVKPDTSRSLAARSLNSNSRYDCVQFNPCPMLSDPLTVVCRIIFFVSPEVSECSDPLKSMVQGDKRAVESFASVLRAKVDGCESEFLRRVIIDLYRKTKMQA